jgi:hypothetical protein
LLHDDWVSSVQVKNGWWVSLVFCPLRRRKPGHFVVIIGDTSSLSCYNVLCSDQDTNCLTFFSSACYPFPQTFCKLNCHS